MSSDKELERFREEWKKELCSRNENDFLNHTTGASDSEVHFCASDVKEKGLIDINKECGAILAIDENSLGLEDEEKFVTSTSKVIEENNEYYPFKILTHFLNEAPRRMKTTNVATKNILATGMTYSKRKYFSNDSEKNIKRARDKKNEPRQTLTNQDHFLDIFIADLDEINEIPFFDISLPREVALKIFQHFDIKTLCRCSQVSKSWKSLADDELLWFHICQELGFEKNLHISHDENWKSIVQRHIQNQRLQISNWKARIGKPYHLSFPRGGVLCAVHSHQTSIVAGYSSCLVRCWDSKTGDTCTFNASNTALVLDEQAEELGRIHNEIKHVRTTALVTAASFKHGFVDVWRNEEGTEPIQTIRFPNPDISSLSTMDINEQRSLVAAAQGSRVQVAVIGGEEENKVHDFEMSSKVAQADWLTSCQSDDHALLLLTCTNSVHLKKINCVYEGDLKPPHLFNQQEDDIEIHNIVWAPVTTVGFRDTDHDVAVGFNMYAPSTQVKLNVYDIGINRLRASLTGHTWLITCVHLPASVPHQLVTGSADRKIRQYDLRAGCTASMTLIGHAARVSTVQMDDWKIVSGDDGGFVYVWDQRMTSKLWDIYNRHPVSYCWFDDRLLITANVPYQKFPHQDEFETVSSLRYRGTVQVYDFMANQQTQGVPDICLSSYNEPEASDYNIGLTVPYDIVE